MGQLGMILIMGGIVVLIVAWVQRRRGWQVIGVLVSLVGWILTLTTCLNTDLLA